MNEVYKLQELIEIFTNHCIEFEKNCKERPDIYPTGDGFNICKAFLTFAVEIKKLDKRIDDHIEYSHAEDL